MGPPNDTPLENQTIRQPGGHIHHYGGDWIANPWDGAATITPTMMAAAEKLKVARRRQLRAGLRNGYIAVDNHHQDIAAIAAELRAAADRLDDIAKQAEPPGPPPRPNHLQPRAAGFRYEGHPPR